MKIKIPKHLEGDGAFVDEGKTWDESTLRTASSGLEVFDATLAGMTMDYMPWNVSNILNFVYHLDRIESANLEFPIILGPTGVVLDGWHRIAKAIYSDHETIKAVRLEVMPEPDEIKQE